MPAVLLNALIKNSTATQAPPVDNTFKTLFFLLLGINILAAAAFFIYKYRKQISSFFGKALSLLKKYTSKAYAVLAGRFSKSIAGFAYSKEQDIFYSTLNAWQRNFGYSRLYDEAAAHFAMIVDCDPVYFEYNGKRWLIEFWKGQYGMTTGCEVGIYNTKRPVFSIPGIDNDSFYDCADNEDMLFISYTLNKNGQELFKREDVHWWLTGFRLGEFSQPQELAIVISITLKDKVMLDAFMGGMRKTGYTDNEITVNGNTVRFVFAAPHSIQPHSRTKEIEDFMQHLNKQNCDAFRELTKDYNGTPSKIAIIRKRNPAIYSSILNSGVSKKIFYKYGRLKN